MADDAGARPVVAVSISLQEALQAKNVKRLEREARKAHQYKVAQASMVSHHQHHGGWVRKLQDCPIYSPTAEEFADPVAYIRRIQPDAAKYGICKIISPHLPVVPPGQVLNDNATDRRQFTFQARVQGLKPVKWTSWASGDFLIKPKRYNLQEYQAVACAYATKRTGSVGHMPPLQGEVEYWRLRELDTRAAGGSGGAATGRGEAAVGGGGCGSVEYANDVVGTAFARPDTGDPLGASKWNLNVLPELPDTLLPYVPYPIPGVTSPMLYIGMLHATFAWHIEDHYLYSVNYHHMGAPKTWYGIPGSDADAFEQVVLADVYGGVLADERRSGLSERLVRDRGLSSLLNKTTVVHPKLLLDRGVRVHRAVQHAGEFVVTFPRAYHAGFSHGFNCGEAVNLGMLEWLPYAAASDLRLARLRRRVLLPTDRITCCAAMEVLNQMAPPQQERQEKEEELGFEKQQRERPVQGIAPATPAAARAAEGGGGRCGGNGGPDADTKGRARGAAARVGSGQRGGHASRCAARRGRGGGGAAAAAQAGSGGVDGPSRASRYPSRNGDRQHQQQPGPKPQQPLEPRRSDVRGGRCAEAAAEVEPGLEARPMEEDETAEGEAGVEEEAVDEAPARAVRRCRMLEVSERQLAPLHDALAATLAEGSAGRPPPQLSALISFWRLIRRHVTHVDVLLRRGASLSELGAGADEDTICSGCEASCFLGYASFPTAEEGDATRCLACATAACAVTDNDEAAQGPAPQQPAAAGGGAATAGTAAAACGADIVVCVSARLRTLVPWVQILDSHLCSYGGPETSLDLGQGLRESALYGDVSGLTSEDYAWDRPYDWARAVRSWPGGLAAPVVPTVAATGVPACGGGGAVAVLQGECDGGAKGTAAADANAAEAPAVAVASPQQPASPDAAAAPVVCSSGERPGQPGDDGGAQGTFGAVVTAEVGREERSAAEGAWRPADTAALPAPTPLVGVNSTAVAFGRTGAAGGGVAGRLLTHTSGAPVATNGADAGGGGSGAGGPDGGADSVSEGLTSSSDTDSDAPIAVLAARAATAAGRRRTRSQGGGPGPSRGGGAPQQPTAQTRGAGAAQVSTIGAGHAVRPPAVGSGPTVAVPSLQLLRLVLVLQQLQQQRQLQLQQLQQQRQGSRQATPQAGAERTTAADGGDTRAAGATASASNADAGTDVKAQGDGSAAQGGPSAAAVTAAAVAATDVGADAAGAETTELPPVPCAAPAGGDAKAAAADEALPAVAAGDAVAVRQAVERATEPECGVADDALNDNEAAAVTAAATPVAAVAQQGIAEEEQQQHYDEPPARKRLRLPDACPPAAAADVPMPATGGSGDAATHLTDGSDAAAAAAAPARNPLLSARMSPRVAKKLRSLQELIRTLPTIPPRKRPPIAATATATNAVTDTAHGAGGPLQGGPLATVAARAVRPVDAAAAAAVDVGRAVSIDGDAGGMQAPGCGAMDAELAKFGAALLGPYDSYGTDMEVDVDLDTGMGGVGMMGMMMFGEEADAFIAAAAAVAVGRGGGGGGDSGRDNGADGGGGEAGPLSVVQDHGSAPLQQADQPPWNMRGQPSPSQARDQDEGQLHQQRHGQHQQQQQQQGGLSWAADTWRPQVPGSPCRDALPDGSLLGGPPALEQAAGMGCSAGVRIAAGLAAGQTPWHGAPPLQPMQQSHSHQQQQMLLMPQDDPNAPILRHYPVSQQGPLMHLAQRTTQGPGAAAGPPPRNLGASPQLPTSPLHLSALLRPTDGTGGLAPAGGPSAMQPPLPLSPWAASCGVSSYAEQRPSPAAQQQQPQALCCPPPSQDASPRWPHAQYLQPGLARMHAPAHQGRVPAAWAGLLPQDVLPPPARGLDQEDDPQRRAAAAPLLPGLCPPSPFASIAKFGPSALRTAHAQQRLPGHVQPLSLPPLEPPPQALQRPHMGSRMGQCSPPRLRQHLHHQHQYQQYQQLQLKQQLAAARLQGPAPLAVLPGRQDPPPPQPPSPPQRPEVFPFSRAGSLPQRQTQQEAPPPLRQAASLPGMPAAGAPPLQQPMPRRPMAVPTSGAAPQSQPPRPLTQPPAAAGEPGGTAVCSLRTAAGQAASSDAWGSCPGPGSRVGPELEPGRSATDTSAGPSGPCVNPNPSTSAGVGAHQGCEPLRGPPPSQHESQQAPSGCSQRSSSPQRRLSSGRASRSDGGCGDGGGGSSSDGAAAASPRGHAAAAVSGDTGAESMAVLPSGVSPSTSQSADGRGGRPGQSAPPGAPPRAGVAGADARADAAGARGSATVLQKPLCVAFPKREGSILSDSDRGRRGVSQATYEPDCGLRTGGGVGKPGLLLTGADREDSCSQQPQPMPQGLSRQQQQRMEWQPSQPTQNACVWSLQPQAMLPLPPQQLQQGLVEEERQSLRRWTPAAPDAPTGQHWRPTVAPAAPAGALKAALRERNQAVVAQLLGGSTVPQGSGGSLPPWLEGPTVAAEVLPQQSQPAAADAQGAAAGVVWVPLPEPRQGAAEGVAQGAGEARPGRDVSAVAAAETEAEAMSAGPDGARAPKRSRVDAPQS